VAFANARITQQELEGYLWGAATILRGLVDAGDYKQFVFPLLFYKRLSDVWDADFGDAIEETGDKKYARATANDRYVIPDGAHWNEVRGVAKDVGALSRRHSAPSRPRIRADSTGSSATPRGPTRSGCPTPR